MRLFHFSSLVCAACFVSTASAASITPVTSTSQVSPNRTIFVDRDRPGTVYSGSSVTFDNGNNRLTFSRDGGDGFETDQVGYNYGGSAFSNGTVVVGAGGFQGSGSGNAVKLAFSAPVVQFALNVEDFDLSGNGTSDTYRINFTAYDLQNQLIGTTLMSSPGCSNNSCLATAGATVDGTAISYVLFAGITGSASQQTMSTNNFVFGNISYVPVGTALQPVVVPPVAVTPEPSSLALLGTGILGVAGVLRKRLA